METVRVMKKICINFNFDDEFMRNHKKYDVHTVYLQLVHKIHGEKYQFHTQL